MTPLYKRRRGYMFRLGGYASLQARCELRIAFGIAECVWRYFSGRWTLLIARQFGCTVGYEGMLRRTTNCLSRFEWFRLGLRCQEDYI